ncbi:MAG: hypothetical protein U5K84_00830 [Alkalibacterium sp.]|nr:hypothetical protein [Alkalibacterium sp.]
MEWISEKLNPSQMEISPNKKWLSFLSSSKDEKPQIHIMPLNGGGPTALTDEEEGVTAYEWTSNGASVYYQTSVKPEENDKEEKVESLKVKAQTITKLQYKMDGQGVTDVEKPTRSEKLDVTAKEPSVILEKDRPFRLQYVSKDESFLLYADKLDPENEWVYGASVYELDLASKDSQLITEDFPKGSFSFEAVNDKEEIFLFTGNDFSHAFVTLDQVCAGTAKSVLSQLLSKADKHVGDVIMGISSRNQRLPCPLAG